MAYCCGPRQKQVSNPAVPFIGTTVPSGTPTDNNAAVAARRLAIVAAFRAETTGRTPIPRAPSEP